jgi:hypothetical protein
MDTGLNSFTRIAIAVVGPSADLLVGQMDIHLGVQNP